MSHPNPVRHHPVCRGKSHHASGAAQDRLPAARADRSVVVAFGALFGILGVIFATPLMVAVLVLINLLYVRDVLGEQPQFPRFYREQSEERSNGSS